MPFALCWRWPHPNRGFTSPTWGMHKGARMPRTSAGNGVPLTEVPWICASVSLIKAAKAAGKAVTVETCPHYLLLAADDVAAGDTRFKCAPPLRHADNRGALVASLVHGDIDMVSSDHSPAPPSLKRLEDGNFLRAWGGIAGLQFGLAATWTAVRNAGGSIDNMSAWWSARPAQLVGLSRKGTIAPGAAYTHVSCLTTDHW